MNDDSTLESSQTDWKTLENMKDEDIDLSEIPEVTAEQIARATLRVGGKSVSRRKVRVNIYLDAEVVAYFKAQAGGRGYQTLVNEALKESIRREGIETLLRRVIREELSLGAEPA
ncbi:MAG: BrnA antitoxin family protein [Caldilineaceae bacterium]|nr:BrnA antitoxin family protein [Caldilineaceae bacterium]MDE0632082.1 BrnA antitoxin family protein [Caldilineaceae bacterium]MXZ23136.1 BrnA antitoxin family protein [Caldilineaceae bacterium SB0665_bin_25]